AGAPAELVVDAPRLVPLGADDVEAAGGEHALLGLVARLAVLLERGAVRLLVGVDPDLGARQRLGVAAEEDVGAAAGHVRGDGDRAGRAGLRDDLRLALVELRVQDVVRDAVPHAPADVRVARDLVDVP